MRMAKIEVKLEADYGYSCSGHGYGSNHTIELEVSDNVLEALRSIDEDEVTREEVVEAIDNCHTGYHLQEYVQHGVGRCKGADDGGNEVYIHRRA